MKVLSLTQIALGIIVILFSCYVAGWMIFEAPHILNTTWLHFDTISPITLYATNGELFTAARIVSGLLLVFGLVTLIAATVQLFRFQSYGAISKRLALIQTSSGFLIVIAAVFVVTQGYPTSLVTNSPFPGPDGTETLGHIFFSPTLPQVRTQLITATTAVTGLAVLVCGTAQFFKAGNKTFRSYDEGHAEEM
jgi:hypothetical protein